MQKILAIVAAMFLASGAFAAVHNVRNFGARGDGKSIDSPAINKAIDAAARQGGGVVYVPAGTYKCYSIRLKSNISLELEKGAVIKAAPTTAGAGYDLAEENPYWKYQDYGHSHWKNSLIWGIGLQNVTICGEGLIDGEGGLSDGYSTGLRDTTKISLDYVLADGVGNKAISLKECRGVTLKDFTVRFGGHFCLLATGVDRLTIDGVTVDTQRDGFDIDCCYGVTVTNCVVNSPWDDGIVLKSTYALGRYKDCENVVISNCRISGFAQGSYLDGTRMAVKPWGVHHDADRRSSGRIKLGTESSGGFKNIAVSNIVFEYCGGLAVETTDGGVIEDLTYDNITMRDCCDSPIFVMIGARMRSPEGRELGAVRRVRFSNINAWNSNPCYNVIITGYKNHRIEDISLSNIHLHTAGGLTPADAKYQVVPETEKRYPDPKLFGVMPTKGMFLRHIDGLQINGMYFSFDKEDSRQLIVQDDVKNVEINGLKY